MKIKSVREARGDCGYREFKIRPGNADMVHQNWLLVIAVAGAACQERIASSKADAARRGATQLGRGDDRQLADFLDLDPHTVARGRQQLLAQDVEVDRTRKAGAGRKRVGKKCPK